jgi:hypothetical protein
LKIRKVEKKMAKADVTVPLGIPEVEVVKTEINQG